MIEVKNPQLGGERDILVFEISIPSVPCLLINVKMRINQKGAPYIVFPCMVIDQEDGKKKYPLLAQFGGPIGEALKTDVLPQLKKLKPEVFNRVG